MPEENHDLTRVVDGRELPVAGKWVLDPAHTSAWFVARHLGVTRVRGRFAGLSGSITVAERPEDSLLEVELVAASISTHNEDRDNHLRSADFLDVENYPKIIFRSTSVEAQADRWKVTGDLTIRAVTRSVGLDVDFLGVFIPPGGKPKAAFAAEVEIDREGWGVDWNVALAEGGDLVSRQVRIEIDAQASLEQ
ncbi:MAG: YceI family protein [Acidimicrobiia bacterium]